MKGVWERSSIYKGVKGSDSKRNLVWLYQTEKTKAESINTDEERHVQMIKLINSTETYRSYKFLCAE